MTIVCGFISPSQFGYLACDSAAVSDDLYSTTVTPKIARVGSTLVGFAGSFREGKQAIETMTRAPRSPLLYLERMWTKLKFTETEFLIIERGKVYEIGTDGAVIEMNEYGAIGNGAGVALGALYVERIDEESARQAVWACSAHVPQIRPPVSCLSEYQGT